jgi:hypothetical protein
MKDPDVTRLDSTGQAFESPAGKALFKITMVVFGVLVSVLLSLILANSERTNNIAEGARDHNYEQDQQIALAAAQAKVMDARIDALQRVSDATVASLQTMVLQVSKQQDTLQHVSDTQKQLLQSQRPRR